MAKTSAEKQLSVYLYIPNIIGYIRVIMNIVAFALSVSNKPLFAILYFISFVCDGLDGWFARKFNQVSTFGAVLDMVTDRWFSITNILVQLMWFVLPFIRVSTACLLAVLSQLYRPGFIFLALLALDIASHWLQMYSTFLSGKASHKDVKDRSNWLLRAYYGNRLFMAFCCVACEVLYIILFLLSENESGSVITVSLAALSGGSLISLPLSLALFGCVLKQAVNIIQMKTAADACVFYDMKRKEKP